MKLTVERLKECLEYNPDTGDFVWLVNKGVNKTKGCIAGTLTDEGYRRITFDRSSYRSHRLAFLYMTGEIPLICDHKNRIKDDNRWCNLRPATRNENMHNSGIRKDNTTGYSGVSRRHKQKKFRVTIAVNGKKIHIGVFACKHNAFCEYVLMSRKLFGKFSPV